MSFTLFKMKSSRTYIPVVQGVADSLKKHFNFSSVVFN